MDHSGGKIGGNTSWDTLPQTTFLTICQIKKGKLSFPSPTPPCNVALLFELPVENNQPRNFEWKWGGGGGRDCIALQNYPIWRQ